MLVFTLHFIGQKVEKQMCDMYSDKHLTLSVRMSLTGCIYINGSMLGDMGVEKSFSVTVPVIDVLLLLLFGKI